MQKNTLPPIEQINLDTPLRLNVAAALAFPDGSMTASGLRRERNLGRLVVERIAGKEYTTLASIDRMRELCRVQQKASVYGSAPHAATGMASNMEQCSSSLIADAKSRLVARLTKPRQPNGRSRNISRKSINAA
jgi:hypothetical protein